MNKEIDLFLIFTKIGLFTIGGGYAMIALMEHELTIKRNYISPQDFPALVAVSQACPGLFALNMAVFIGNRLAGIRGAIYAGLGVSLAPFFCLLFIAMFFKTCRDSKLVESIFYGLRPAIVALIAVPVFNTAKKAEVNIKNVCIPIFASVLVWAFGVSPIFIIFAAIAGGLLKFFIKKTNP